MIYEYKEIICGAEARKKLKAGFDMVAKVISSTLGPAGKNVIMERKGLGWGKVGAPRIIDDGYYTAQQIVLKDPIEDLGAQSLVNVATVQNSMVGDGTTTAMVLCHAIVDKIFKKLSENDMAIEAIENTAKISKKITESCKNIVIKLKGISKPVKTKAEIENVAVISLKDEQMGKMVADMVNEIGKDGFISVEDSMGTEMRTETISGMKLLGSYLDQQLSTNNHKEAVMKEPLILVYNGQIETQSMLTQIAQYLIKQGKRELVIICDSYARELLPQILLNWQKKIFYCLAIKVPSLTTEQYEDIAIYTGAKFIDKNQAIEGIPMDWNIFGKAKKVMANQDNVFIVEGKGDKKMIEERIEKLKEQRKDEKIEEFKKKLDRRIASLAGGVGLIEVAANTEGEQDYKFGKIEDAVAACKAAMEEGIVKGGGLALKEIDDQLPEDDILKGVLSAPYEIIKANAGEELAITENIIDPTKVVRCALENACSLANIFINCETGIAWHKNKLTDELGEMAEERQKQKYNLD